ncbi:MAG: hypothetical protein H8M99_02120 [Gloeobacteraceae cyanobacterium ES-bin-144]|nr:hypothetical protein [Verrucomicrobiales bacterium]
MKFLLGSLVTVLCLCQCSIYRPGRADGIDPNPFALLEEQATAANRDPSRISVPVLRSPVLEKRWGSPKLLVGPKGGYALRYTNSKNNANHLTIFGSPQHYKPAGLIPPPYTDLGHDKKMKTFNPVEVSQTWSYVTIAGKSVRYYISQGPSGDEGTQFSTETFRMTAPNGRTASYRIRVSTVGANPKEQAPGLIQSCAFKSGGH